MPQIDSLKLRSTRYLGSTGTEYTPEELVVVDVRTPFLIELAATQMPDIGFPALSVITPLMVGS